MNLASLAEQKNVWNFPNLLGIVCVFPLFAAVAVAKLYLMSYRAIKGERSTQRSCRKLQQQTAAEYANIFFQVESLRDSCK